MHTTWLVESRPLLSNHREDCTLPKHTRNNTLLLLTFFGKAAEMGRLICTYDTTAIGSVLLLINNNYFPWILRMLYCPIPITYTVGPMRSKQARLERTHSS